MKSIALFITAFAASVAGFMPAQAQTPSTLSISKPNGYATTVANDFNHKTALGAVRWMRVWDGYEWKFNPHWESLSTSWGNLTGSQSANTTVGDIPVSAGTTLTGVDKPPPNLLYSSVSSTTSSSSSGGGSGGGCWAWVDEDWQPSYTSVMFFDPEDPAVTMEREAGPMIPLRSTPFNRGIQGEAGTAANTDYVAAKSVSIDYATLCPGGSDSGSSAVQEKEALRRSNELYVGTDGRYSFNNRSVLEKRAVKQLATAAKATQYANIASGQLAASILANPIVNAKGYRWIDKSGDWTDYNTQGQVVAFGDKNNNIIWLLRDTDGLLIAVIDGNASAGNPASAGKVLYSLYYSGQLVTQVKDYSNPNINAALDQPNRSISYQYDDKNRLTQVTDARGGITTYTYDKRNRIIKITDPENRIEKFGYIGDTTRRRTAPDGGVSDYVFEYDDVNKQFTSKIQGPETAAGRTSEIYTHNRVGKLVGQTLNGRAELHIKYDTGNRSEVRTNARGFGTRLTKNEFEQLVQIDQADGTSSSKSYSAQHLGLTQETDELGIVTQYQYDTKGNLTQKRQAAGTTDERVTNYLKNSQGRTIQITRVGKTEANGTVTPDATWKFEYDAQGEIKKTIDPEGNARQYVYDRDGNPRQYTDPLGKTTTYEVDVHGNITKATDALGQVRSYQYDKAGNLISQTDARGKAMQMAYDAMNRNTQVTNAIGGSYKLQYNAQGLPITETDEDGRKSEVQYDNFQRLTQQIDGKGNITAHEYSIADGSSTGALGALLMPTQTKYPTYTTQQRYDQLERLTTNTTLNPTTGGIEGLVSSNKYDKRGRVIETTNADGKTSYFSYDALGRTTRFTNSLGKSIELMWDVRSNLIQIKDANANITKFTYDSANRLTKEALPLGQTTSYTYDAKGNRSTVVDALGNKISYTYDAADRPTRTEVLAVGQTAASLVYTFTHDAESMLTGWSNGTQSASYTYDDAGRRLSETLNYGNNISLNYSYTYTPAGYVKSLTYPDGTQVNYTFEEHGQLGSVAIAGEGSLSVNTWNWVAPKKLTLPGGTTREMSHDGLLKLTGLKVKNPGQQTIFEIASQYGKLEEIKQTAITDANTTSSSTITHQYSYDNEQRLSQGSRDAGGLFGVSGETFGYDAVGNRITHSAVSGALVYDANNRLTQRGTGNTATSYQYDANGNLSSKTVGTTGAANSITRYGYDALNRLTEVKDGSNAMIARYAYDLFDNRIIKDSYIDSTGQLLTTPQRTHYLYGDEGLLAEANGAGVVTTQYGWKPDGGWGTDPLFIKTTISNGSTTNPSSATAYAYFHNDHLGTPLRATDKAGNIVWRADYTSFGQASPASDNRLTNNLRFAGQYFDAETGLHYNTRRYYDPTVGRYISADPIGIAGGWNLYDYANADPANQVDPTGEWVWLVFNVAMTVYDVYTEYQQYKETGCVDWTRIIPVPKVIPRIKWLKKTKKQCSNPCECAGGGKNSFTADTLVHTQDTNGLATLKPISTLKLGDKVLAKSEWKADADSLSYEAVTDIMLTPNQERTLVHLSLSNGQKITTTDGHPFKTTEGWRDAVLLKKGGKLLLKGDAEQALEITDISQSTEKVTTYNLEVANAHTFFVGEQGVLVHNGFGAYFFTFPDGSWYAGKGDKKRRAKSIKERGKGQQPVVCNFFPANNDRDSFILEDIAIEAAGDISDSNSLNKINSPGKGLRGR